MTTTRHQTTAPARSALAGEVAVELQGVTKGFARKEVLCGLNLAIWTGEVLTILGGSGSGKSVLLRLIIGLMKPEAGQILIQGRDIVPLSEAELLKVRQRVGMLFQGGALFDSLTVAENVAFPLREHTTMSEGQIMSRVEEVLALVGLAGIGKQMPAELSGGMRKRVALARAIALPPRIILYDEPTTGLDPQNVEKINELIVDLQAKLDLTSVVVTHDLQSTFRISDRIALLSRGRIALVATPAEMARTEDPEVRAFLDVSHEAGTPRHA